MNDPFTILLQIKYQIGLILFWPMSQFGPLELGRLQPLLRLRKYDFEKALIYLYFNLKFNCNDLPRQYIYLG